MANVNIKLNGGLNKFIKKISIKNSEVNAGFIKPENAKIAIKLEFGGIFSVSDEYKQRATNKGIELGDYIEIPPRPFMQYTFDDYSKNWSNQIKTDMIEYNYNMKKVLDNQGKRMKSEIQNTMLDHSAYEDNGIITQKIKGKNTPLLDTGHLINSVEYKIS